jgi:serine/threonine-protein kinase
MGMVYLGRTEGAAGFSRPVVIKRILPDLVNDPNMVNMFVREARILSELRHPGIVNVIDFGEEDSAYVMVLEYVHGYDLGRWHKYLTLAHQGMPYEFAIHVMAKVLDALHHAHTLTRDGKLLGIVHRDVSPGNVLLDLEGSIKLADFGIARMEHDLGEYRTQEGVFKGKLSYAAPELLQGSEAGPRSDVYSCGVVLYQLLSGKNPFRGQGMPETVTRVLTLTPASVLESCPEAPKEIDTVMARALAKLKDDRFVDAAAFAEALRRVRPRSEAEVQNALIAAVQKDFNSDMAEIMGLDPLTERDQMWRESLPPDTAGRLFSTPPPPPPDPANTTRTVIEVPSHSGLMLTADGIQRVQAPEQANSRLGLKLGLLAFFLLAAVAVAFFVLQRPKEEPAPRYIVVESGNNAEAAGSEAVAPDPIDVSALPIESAAPAASSAPEPPPEAGGTPSVVGPAKAPGPTTKKGPDPAALTRTFMRNQGRVQRCVTNHAKEVSGSPKVAIRFQVDESGSPSSVTLSPPRLASTPLGQCLLAVGRDTRFGPQSAPVSFSIPITVSGS